MSEKLPVMATLQEAARLVAQNRRELLRVGLVFIAGFFATGVILWNFLLPLMARAGADATGHMNVDPRLPAGLLLTGVIEFLLFAVFAVGWHRVILLGRNRAGGGLVRQAHGGEAADLFRRESDLPTLEGRGGEGGRSAGEGFVVKLRGGRVHFGLPFRRQVRRNGLFRRHPGHGIVKVEMHGGHGHEDDREADQGGIERAAAGLGDGALRRGHRDSHQRTGRPAHSG
jgi:hypothetical protein